MQVWPAAELLCQFLVAKDPSWLKGKRVLELGAGQGMDDCVTPPSFSLASFPLFFGTRWFPPSLTHTISRRYALYPSLRAHAHTSPSSPHSPLRPHGHACESSERRGRCAHRLRRRGHGVTAEKHRRKLCRRRCGRWCYTFV